MNFYIVSTIIAVLLHVTNNIVLEKVYEKGQRKIGRLCKIPKEKFSIKSVLSFLGDFIPYVNIIGIVMNILADVLIIKFYDVLMEKSEYSYPAWRVKYNYEKSITDKQDIIDSLKIDGASLKEQNEVINQVDKVVGKKEKGSSFTIEPDFSESDYEWACTYLDAQEFIDSLFTEVTLSKKEKLAIVNELISYVREFEKYNEEKDQKEMTERKTQFFVRDEKVSDKVLEIIMKHKSI